MDRNLTEREVEAISKASGEVTLAECIATAAKRQVDKEKVRILATLLASIAKDSGNSGTELLAACAYICINQLLVPHEEETNTKGFFHA